MKRWFGGVGMLASLLFTASAEGQSEPPQPVTDLPVFLTRSLRHGVDTTVSPCDDFYRFANGGWITSTVLPDSVERLSVFHATYYQTQVLIARVLDSARRSIGTDVDIDADLRVLGIYYESCLRVDSLPRTVQGVSMYQALKPDTSRASRCGRLAMHYLPEAMGQVFVRTVLTPQVDAKSREVIEAIRTQIAARVSKLTYVSADAKTRTLDALRYMTFKVAKPSDTIDYRGLTLTPGDFLANQRKIQEYTWKTRLVSNDGTRKPVWADVQYNPNAHFNPRTNSIEIPSFVFQWPFFDAQDDALSYAAAGLILGHEVIHGVTWKLGSEGDASVHKHAQILVQQYSAFRVLDDYSVDGSLTLNENLADLGGLLAAYDAWAGARSSSAPSVEGFTPEQQFFLHYARLWREKKTKAALQRQLLSDPHAPGIARVNAVVMNVPAFANAFGCKEGDPMVRPASQRANIW